MPSQMANSKSEKELIWSNRILAFLVVILFFALVISIGKQNSWFKPIMPLVGSGQYLY